MQINTFQNTYKNFINVNTETFKDFIAKKQTQKPLASIVIDPPEATKPKQNNKKLFGIIGISVGSVALLSIITFFTITKGFSGNIGKKLKHISDKAKKVIFDLTTQQQHLTETQKIKLRISKFVKNCADGLQASSNISAVKDSATLKIMQKLKLQKIADKINLFFKDKLVLKNKNIAYNEAEIATINFCNYLDKIAKNNELPELAQKAKEILTQYEKKFSTPQHIKRSEETWKSLNSLHNKVYEALFKQKGGFLKNIKQLKSYITADLIAPRRTMVLKDLNTAKSNISNNLTDVNNNIKLAFNELKTSVNPKNIKAVKLMKELTELIDQTKTLKGINESQNREKLFKLITTQLNELLEISKNDISNTKDFEIAKQKIYKLNELINPDSYKKGLAQEAVTIIKNITKDGTKSPEYKLAIKLMNKMNTKLNSAIWQENNAYEKLAELAVGSAPADVFGILWPTALGTALVVTADGKNERISKTLTQGIPILGGVGVTYYGTVRGYTGVKNLILGLASGYLLNLIGTKADELVKKYQHQQNKLKTALDSLAKLQKTQ